MGVSNRKQKKKEKKELAKSKANVNKLSEIEKEALFKTDEGIRDEHLVAKDITDSQIIDSAIINQIIETNGPSDIDDKNIDVTKKEHHNDLFHHDIFGKHGEGVKHNVIFLWVLLAIMFLLICVEISLNFAKDEVIEENQNLIAALNTKLDTEISNKNAAEAKNSELENKVITLSETVSLKTDEVNVANEEIRTLKVPSSYPLKGTAAIISDLGDNEDNNNNNENEDADNVEDDVEDVEEQPEDGNNEEIDINLIDLDYSDKPYTMFMTAADTTVVASGYGKIVAITQDSEFGYAIKIDHQNGYFSIYRGYGVPLVNVGDTVSRGCILMSISGDNKKFLYEIIFNNKYLNPMDIMEING